MCTLNLVMLSLRHGDAAARPDSLCTRTPRQPPRAAADAGAPPDAATLCRFLRRLRAVTPAAIVEAIAAMTVAQLDGHLLRTPAHETAQDLHTSCNWVCTHLDGQTMDPAPRVQMLRNTRAFLGALPPHLVESYFEVRTFQSRARLHRPLEKDVATW